MVQRKRTNLQIAGAAESARLAVTLGRELRIARRRRRLTEAQLGARVGLAQSRISELERGGGASLRLGAWIALGLAVGRPLGVALSRDVDLGPADAGHLDIQEGLARLAQRGGYPVRVELPTRAADPAHSVDVAARDAAGRFLLLEGWNVIGDLGASLRSTDRKVAEARGQSPDGDVRVCWVVRATAANRALLRRYPTIFRSRFPGSSAAWAKALIEGSEPPTDPGLVWWVDDRPVAVRWRSGG